MTLLVVRHGRTAANAAGLLVGRADPGLDELGRRQAELTAAAAGPVDVVVSSPLQRARETAAAFGAPVEVDERFVELDYGEWDLRPVHDVPAEVWRAWRADPGFRPPGGESLAELGRRVRAGCEQLAERVRAGQRVAVVSHVSPVKAAVCWALGVGDEVAWRTWVAPASITRIGVGGGGPSLRSFNEVAHLAGVG